MNILAFDFGGTRGRCCLAEDDGQYTNVRTLDRAPDDDGNAWLQKLLTAGREVAAHASGIQVVGISFGGPVTPEGRVLSMHVKGWESVDLLREMTLAFKLPVVIENDANAGALGEFRFGAGRGCRYMAYFTVSTGIGGGVILDEKLYRGAHGMAAEFGHMVMHPGPGAPQYAAGKPGVLEALASGPAMGRDAQARLSELGRPESAFNARDLFECAGRMEPWAVEVRDRAVGHLARGVAAALCAYDLERVVIGGGVALAGAPFFEPLRAAVKQYLPHFLEGKADIVPAALGDHAALLGAVAAGADFISS